MMGRFEHAVDLLVAAAFGALASLPFHPTVDTMLKRAFCVAMAAVGASYVTPLAASYFALDDGKLAGLGFLVGLFGLSFVQAAMTAIRNADLWGLVRERLGGSK